MSFYWIYDLPTGCCAPDRRHSWDLSLAGLFVSRPIVKRLVGSCSKHNDIVSYFLAGDGGLLWVGSRAIAVATWENYTEVDAVVTSEAAALASLYRDFDGYPQPLRGSLENDLREYTRTVIEKEWPAHKHGMALEDGDAILDRLENEVMNFEPSSEREKIVHAEVLRSLDTVVEQRRLRLQAVSTGLPAALWAVVLIGAVLNGLLTYLFWVENLKLHALARRDPGQLHRALDLSDRRDGQPVPRRVQRELPTSSRPSSKIDALVRLSSPLML